MFLEFGGRNITEPRKHAVIRPYLLESASGLEFPQANVDVLIPERTFWEKATLAHVACGKGKTSGNADRAARHWYDLAVLAKHQIGVRALADRALLDDVVKYKRVFFPAQYDECLTGGMRLIPADPLLSELRRDYETMAAEGLLYGDRLTFDEIIAELKDLERAINAGKCTEGGG